LRVVMMRVLGHRLPRRRDECNHDVAAHVSRNGRPGTR
jgi:hypothetical protein